MDASTGEIVRLIQSDIHDSGFVHVRDASGNIIRVSIISLVCLVCGTSIMPGNGVDIFYCGSYLESMYGLAGGGVRE